jgi:hypothetical protein
MRAMRQRLTYANVVASLALFLALSGGVVYAANKVGTKNLKANAVSAGKIKPNAVTSGKIRGNAVTAPKIKNGAVNFTKLATGTNLIATASGGPVAANGTVAVDVPLSGTVTFTPADGTAAFLSVEAKGNNLARVGEKPCEARVIPFVNGSAWGAEGALKLSSFAPTAEQPTGLVPVAGETGPVGLTSPDTAQTVSVKVLGSLECTATSTVSVAVAVTQAK